MTGAGWLAACRRTSRDSIDVRARCWRREGAGKGGEAPRSVLGLGPEPERGTVRGRTFRERPALPHVPEDDTAAQTTIRPAGRSDFPRVPCEPESLDRECRLVVHDFHGLSLWDCMHRALLIASRRQRTRAGRAHHDSEATSPASSACCPPPVPAPPFNADSSLSHEHRQEGRYLTDGEAGPVGEVLGAHGPGFPEAFENGVSPFRSTSRSSEPLPALHPTPRVQADIDRFRVDDDDMKCLWRTPSIDKFLQYPPFFTPRIPEPVCSVMAAADPRMT